MPCSHVHIIYTILYIHIWFPSREKANPETTNVIIVGIVFPMIIYQYVDTN